jgi:uncharacterized RDD family membrane protein YckC
LAAVVWVAVSTGPIAAQTLSVAGGDGHTWVVQNSRDSSTATVLHRVSDAPPGEVQEAGQYQGKLTSGGLAASENRLWLVYQDRTVQSLRAGRSDGPIQQWTFAQSLASRLPEGELRDCAGAGGRPWALIAVSQGKVLRELDQPKRAATQVATQTAPQPAPDATQPKASELAKPADRLVVLQQGSWKTVPLPDAWPHGAKAWILPGPGSRPRLLVRDQTNQLTLFRWDESGWQSTAYDYEADGPLAATVVQQQVVIAHRAESGPPLRVALHLLRGGQVYPVGQVQLDGTEAGARWNLLPDDLAVAVYADREPPAAEQPTPSDSEEQDWSLLPQSEQQTRQGPIDVAYATMGLDGEPLQKPVQMKVVPPATRSSLPEFVMVGTLVAAMVLMLTFWRRDGVAAAAELPSGVKLGALTRRAMAGGLDMLPAVVLAMTAFKLGPGELLASWPGQPSATEFGEMLPGLVAIAIMLVHTTVAEALWGRSLGKALTGLRVTNLSGERAQTWQILVRGGLKLLDLVVWLLLVLAIVSPNHQRLGDLVARTLVVEDESGQQQQEQ